MPTTPAWLGLGSNLGDRRATLDAALAALDEAPGVAVRAVSRYQETRPVGGPSGQGAFLNAAVRVETTLDPFAMLKVTQEIEDRLGRVRSVRWGERTVDLDLLIFGSKFLDTPELQLPHPRLAFRRFVLAPLAEIAPRIADTRWHRTTADLLANLDRRPRAVALHGPPGPLKSEVFRRLVESLSARGIEGDSTGILTRTVGGSSRRRARDGDRRSEGSGAWIVADFCRQLEPFAPGLTLAQIRDLRSTGPTKVSDLRAALLRVEEVARRSLIPTFAVLLPGSPDHRAPLRGPGPPRLRPDSDDPDAVVAEVLATCRGIEEI